jgi:hypothetical protein
MDKVCSNSRHGPAGPREIHVGRSELRRAISLASSFSWSAIRADTSSSSAPPDRAAACSIRSWMFCRTMAIRSSSSEIVRPPLIAYSPAEWARSPDDYATRESCYWRFIAARTVTANRRNVGHLPVLRTSIGVRIWHLRKGELGTRKYGRETASVEQSVRRAAQVHLLR